MGTPPTEGKVPEEKPSSLEGRRGWLGSRGESLRPRPEDDIELDSQDVFRRELGDTPPEEAELMRRGGPEVGQLWLILA